MSVDLLEPAAAALGELRDRVVFLGGATIALWLTDPAARAPRVTYDVDVVAVEVTTLGAYETFQHELRRLRFNEDVHSGVIGRWLHIERGIVIDVVPARAELAGFSGQWLSAAVGDPAEVRLPSGTTIRVVQPPWLIATKLEAFRGRGQSDCLRSRDFEDIITLVDGREQLIDELRGLPADAQHYIGQETAAILQLPSFAYGVEGALPAGEATRADAVTVPRLATIAAL